MTPPVTSPFTTGAQRACVNTAGIFVGGQSRRMGGRPKGLIALASGETIVERWCGLLRSLSLETEIAITLVGAADAYAHLALPSLADEVPGIGPLGGLLALLRHASARGGHVLAVACDMPFVSPALLARLVETPSDAAVLAPRRDGRWEPLFARYDAARVLPIALARAGSTRHSLQGLLDDAGAAALPLSPGEELELRDFDRPEDIPG